MYSYCKSSENQKCRTIEFKDKLQQLDNVPILGVTLEKIEPQLETALRTFT
jgi:hypothetical protein